MCLPIGASGLKLFSLICFVVFGASALAEECEKPLEFRSVSPANEAVDVPLDSRVLVSFIGQGRADEFEVDLEVGGEAVSSTDESWCYPHEGPFEVHCWWSLKPDDLLPSTAEIQVRIQSTSSYQGEEAIQRTERFTTGQALTENIIESPPSLAILEVIDIPESELSECDFRQPRRAIFQADSEVPDPYGLSVFHVDELSVEGNYFRAHTVFVTLAAPPMLHGHNTFKQYVNLEEPYTGCYRVWAEDGAGSPTDVSTICWPGYGDTGYGDTGYGETGIETGVETGQETGGSNGTGLDTGSAQDSSDDSSKAVPAKLTCGCSSGANHKSLWFCSLVLVAFLSHRRVPLEDQTS